MTNCKNLYKKLLEVKKGLPYLKKEAKGFQYSYNKPSQVLASVNPLLNDNDLFLKTEVINVETERMHTGYFADKTLKKVVEKWEILYKVEILYTFIDTESGESEENRFFAAGLNGQDKGFGSALTYGERYFFLKYFNIPVDEDDLDAFQTKQMSQEERDVIIAKEKAASEKELRYANVARWIEESTSRNKLGAVWTILNDEEKAHFNDAVKEKTETLTPKASKQKAPKTPKKP